MWHLPKSQTLLDNVVAFGLKLLAAQQQPWTWWTSQYTPLGLNDEWLAVRKIIFGKKGVQGAVPLLLLKLCRFFWTQRKYPKLRCCCIQQYGTARGSSSQLLQVLQSRKPLWKFVGSSSQLSDGQSQLQVFLHFFGQFQNRIQIKTKISRKN